MSSRAFGERNPYLDCTFSELHRKCTALIVELERKEVRTPAARRELVEDTRMLLLAVAARFHEFSEGMPGTPEKEVGRLNRDFVASFEAFRAKREKDGARQARLEAIQRAADFVLGRDAVRWLNDPLALWNERRAYRAAQSDEEFEAFLRELAALRK